jgi:general secretion pathway protein G
MCSEKALWCRLSSLRPRRAGCAGLFIRARQNDRPAQPALRSAGWKACTTNKAFSLVEFTAVLALMAIIAAIVTISVRPLMVKGKQDAARTEIGNICNALEAFHGVYGRYPTNEEGLGILRRKTEKLTEPLLTGDPIDPWGRAYQYNTPGREGPYEVICFGADGKLGGDGGDKDIVSWNLKDKAK